MVCQIQAESDQLDRGRVFSQFNGGEVVEREDRALRAKGHGETLYPNLGR